MEPCHFEENLNEKLLSMLCITSTTVFHSEFFLTRLSKLLNESTRNCLLGPSKDIRFGLMVTSTTHFIQKVWLKRAIPLKGETLHDELGPSV
jgi:hypothetical protein